MDGSTFSGNNAVGLNGYGAGIYTTTLTLTNSTVSSNTATAAATGIDSGGGISAVTATLTGSTVSRNSVTGAGGSTGSGGGIAATTLTVTASTINNNSAGGSGNTGQGGGISGNTITLTNSTLSGNSANGVGGGIRSFTSVTLFSSTISGNTAGVGTGGGIYNTGTGTLRNTILAGNTAAQASPDCFGTFTSQGYNIIGNNAGCAFAPSTGDQVGTPAAPIDPRVGPLANNGGPTQTLALLPGSPAIDAGICTDASNVTLGTDQRGSPRPSPAGGSCDIGAYEAHLTCNISAVVASPIAYAAIYVSSAPILNQFIFLRTTQYSRLVVRNPVVTSCGGAGTVATITGTAAIGTRQFKPGDPVIVTVKTAMPGGPVTEIDVQDTNSGPAYVFFPTAGRIQFSAS